MSDDFLMQTIKKSLVELEEHGDVVLCANTPNAPAKCLYTAVSALVPNSSISASELSGLRSLVLYAINDKRFFDWEMPTLTGFNAEEFKKIAEKLPKG